MTAALPQKTMRCIFCLLDRLPAAEHVFQYAIGGTLVIDRVCESCNSFLGSKVDARLVDHPLVAFRRSSLGLRGTSGKLPDGLRLLFGDLTLAGDPDVKLRVSTDPRTGEPDVYRFYSVSETPLANGKVERRVVVDARDVKQLPTILQRERQRAGLASLSKQELDQEVAQAVRNTRTIEKAEAIASISVDLAAFRRGMLKIAYELAFLWLGEAYLDDPMAAVLRDVVFGRTAEQDAQLHGRIEIGADMPVFRFWAEQQDCHVAFSVALDRRVLVNLRVFDILSARMVVTEKASRYLQDQFDPQRVRFLLIDPAACAMRHTSFVDELQKITARHSQRPYAS